MLCMIFKDLMVDLIIDKIMETESNNREKAVTDFMKEILKDAGYKRFIDPINRTFPDKGTIFCQEYLEFIIKRLKGELIDILDTLKICGNLYQSGCLELRDKEDIEAGIQEIVRRRKANWAFLFVAAIKESQEYVKCKMDPSSTNEDLVRAGVLVVENTGNPYGSEITKAFRDIT
ncbi:unnamed protein product [Mytilus coruscus]|uniref:Uncharacterized protein n=1 Tax=Mytilus coruscus TaxID=42192 RepID=A0A6J8ET44_MYTCO|nr:unnamed protein product [Mytilus coruscus]